MLADVSFCLDLPMLARLLAVLIVALPAPAFAQATAATPAYCQKQHAMCRTLCNQVTPAGSAKRATCDTGCDRSVGTCLQSGSYNFAPVEQFMPEFHPQQ